MQPKTHLALDPTLCGTPSTLDPGHAVLVLETTAAMAADAHGLVHGGFVFGLADAAAMFAVNEPHVVLASAETRFLAPVVVEERLRAEARVVRNEGKKHVVEVVVTRGDDAVFSGTFLCVVPARHVLAGRVGTDGEGRP